MNLDRKLVINSDPKTFEDTTIHLTIPNNTLHNLIDLHLLSTHLRQFSNSTVSNNFSQLLADLNFYKKILWHDSGFSDS